MRARFMRQVIPLLSSLFGLYCTGRNSTASTITDGAGGALHNEPVQAALSSKSSGVAICLDLLHELAGGYPSVVLILSNAVVRVGN